MSRIESSVKNIKVSIFGQFISIIFNFITRMVFVRVLSAEYLGINGLFSNILSVLSFAELGIGSAIVYSMYKPLADKNEAELKALMNLYKRAYISIGTIILVVGMSITPFLELFIKNMPNIPYIRLIYILYVLNTSFSYFFSYKKSFLIADQKKYIDSIYHYSFLLIRNILQVIILLFTQNFILYLGVQILITVTQNIVVARKVDKMYPFLVETKNFELDHNEKKNIFRNVKAMMLHKIGSVIVIGTDNLLISKLIGIAEVGLYSNYLLITGALDQAFVLIFQSMTASIGNLGVSETEEKNKFIFNCIDLFGYWIYAFAAICLIILFNPFINLWLGEEYLFSLEIVLVIVVNFYLSGRRNSVLTFRNALGLFWHDRYKPIFEAVINLIASIILAKVIGIQGIILGTIISTLSTCFWIEPFILFKHGFKSSVRPYFMKYIVSTVYMIIVGIPTWIISDLFSAYTLLGFIGKLLVCAILPNILFLGIFWRTKEFQYLFSIVKPMMYKFFSIFKIKCNMGVK